MTSSNRRGRPPRAGREAETSRRELLDAAGEEFSSQGYAGATVAKIIERAGLSKGTFYWNFDTKEDLFVALLEDRLDRPARELVALLQGAPTRERTGLSISHGLASLFSRDPQIVRLLHEYWSAATRDAASAARYRQRHAHLRSALAAGLDERHDQTDIPLGIPAAQLAEAFIGLAIGLSMSALLDPASVPDDLFGDIASLVYDGLVHRAASRSSPG